MKNYRYIRMPLSFVNVVLFLIAFAFLLPSEDASGVYGQEDPRCENNRRAIKDYKRQIRDLEVIRDDKRGNREFALDAREQYATLRRAIPNRKMHPDYVTKSLRRYWANIFNLEYDNSWDTDQRAFQIALRDRLGQLLDKAKGYTDFANIEREIENLEKRINEHERNLIALGCGERTEKSDREDNKVSGTWNWECCEKKYSATFTLVQNGNKLSGSFSDGTKIEGDINGSTVTFKRTGSFGRQDFTLTLSADGKTLTGSFTGDRNKSVGVQFTATRP